VWLHIKNGFYKQLNINNLNFQIMLQFKQQMRVMETDTIQKNEASPKSLTSRRNFLRKSILTLSIFVLFGTYCFGQTVGVQVIGGSNEPTIINEPGHRINGICTSEDLGGVEALIRNVTDRHRGIYEGHLDFENFNDFAVTVIYEIRNDIGYASTGNIVLRAGQRRTVQAPFQVIGVKLIARRLGNPAEPAPVSTTTTNVPTNVPLLAGFLYVFPEDLGIFSEKPTDLIEGINRGKAHGIGNWRLPTPAEFALLRQSHRELGLSYWMNGGAQVFGYATEENGRVSGGNAQNIHDTRFRIRLVATKQ